MIPLILLQLLLARVSTKRKGLQEHQEEHKAEQQKIHLGFVRLGAVVSYQGDFQVGSRALGSVGIVMVLTPQGH